LDETVGEGYTNVALFAGDSRTGQLDKGVRSDGIIILSLNNETKEVKMVSVYRDTLLDLSNGSYAKCNSAYSYGGAKQAVSMLNMNLDLNIKQFVTVDFKAVSEAIDMLGGIEVEVSEAEANAVNKFIDETARVAGKKANYLYGGGLKTLDGVQATTYARIRKGVGDDYARTERQRIIIQKAMEKALKTDLSTLNKIVDTVLPKVYTNIKKREILSYATALTKYKVTETKGFPFDKTSATLSGKGSCVIPVTLASNVTMLHEFLFGTVDYKPSSKVWTISDTIQGLAGNRQPDANVPYDPDAYHVDDDKKPEEEEPEEKPEDKHKHSWSASWTGSDTHHWHECQKKNCPITDNTQKKGYGAHSGGQATCGQGAICDVCKKAYGSVNAQNHTGETEVRDAVAATETQDGYSGDTYCKGCGAKLATGSVIPATGGAGTGDEGAGEGEGDQTNKTE